MDYGSYATYWANRCPSTPSQYDGDTNLTLPGDCNNNQNCIQVALKFRDGGPAHGHKPDISLPAKRDHRVRPTKNTYGGKLQIDEFNELVKFELKGKTYWAQLWFYTVKEMNAPGGQQVKQVRVFATGQQIDEGNIQSEPVADLEPADVTVSPGNRKVVYISRGAIVHQVILFDAVPE